MKHPLSLCLLLASLAGCAPSRGLAPGEASPTLLFLNLQFERREDQVRVKDTGRIKAPGKMKQSDALPAEPGFVCQLLDRKGGVLATLPIGDPLRQSVESPDDDGHLHRTTISVTTAECPLRIQLPAGCTRIAIEDPRLPNPRLLIIKI